MLQTGFPAIVHRSATTLVLGSMPGRESLARNEYYAHARNAFWPIVAALAGLELPNTYEARLALLKAQQIGLWDVIDRCERAGSLDSAIVETSVQVNDFARLFCEFPNISRVVFNGKKAADIFNRHVKRRDAITDRPITYFCLPSTSPANAGMRFEDKLTHWRQALTD